MHTVYGARVTLACQHVERERCCPRALPPPAAPLPQARQAGFVAACVRQLQVAHTASGSAVPFRLAVVAYSMGGAVARAALRQLGSDPRFGGSPVLLPLQP